jgi:hypothetical protein
MTARSDAHHLGPDQREHGGGGEPHLMLAERTAVTAERVGPQAIGARELKRAGGNR